MPIRKGSPNNDALLLRIQIVPTVHVGQGLIRPPGMTHGPQPNVLSRNLFQDGHDQFDGPFPRIPRTDVIGSQEGGKTIPQQGHLGLGQDAIEMGVQVIPRNILHKDKAISLHAFLTCHFLENVKEGPALYHTYKNRKQHTVRSSTTAASCKDTCSVLLQYSTYHCVFGSDGGYGADSGGRKRNLSEGCPHPPSWHHPVSLGGTLSKSRTT
jgi:hypothetical protein